MHARDTRLYRQWLIANGWAEAAGLGTTFVAGRLVAPHIERVTGVAAILGGALGAVLLGALLEGVLVGLVQERVLRRRLPSLRRGAWIIATSAGAGLAWLLGMVPSTLMALVSTAPPSSAPEEPGALVQSGLAMALGFVTGPILGLAQWTVLRRLVPSAGRWLWANALAWAAGMPVIFLGMQLVPWTGPFVLVALTLYLVCGITGVVVGAIHGRVLVRLLQSPQQAKPWRGSLEGLYQAEVAMELARHPVNAPGLITENDIARLPPPIQRYFRASGFIGTPHTLNMRIHWSHMQLKRSHDADWMELSCQQFNSVPEPMRIALMKGRMAGVIPFEGRDKYQEGHGNMLIRLLKLITLGDSKGTYMDESALVTVLSEALMAPSYALQAYMKWQPVDERSASAELTYGGITVRGLFRFNEADELIQFDTSDRWQEGTPPKRLPWSAHFDGYRVERGIRYATRVSATWHEPAGDQTYVQGTMESVEFNVKNG